MLIAPCLVNFIMADMEEVCSCISVWESFILNACCLVNFCYALQTVALPCCSLFMHLKICFVKVLHTQILIIICFGESALVR